MLDDSYETVCNNRDMNLNFHSVLCIAPKGCNSEMLLYPTKEQFNLPALFIQHGDVFRPDAHVVGQKRECSLNIRSIVNSPPKHGIYKVFEKNLSDTSDNIFYRDRLGEFRGYILSFKEK